MLTKWKLFNFKAVQQETELEFKPLTIFAGANSSGKSTVLQSILLVTQSLGNAVTNRPIVLNGDLARLGQFDDLKSLGSEADQITIGWELKPIETKLTVRPQGFISRPIRQFFDPEELVQEVRTEISFDALSGISPSEVQQLQPSLVTMELDAVIRTDEEGFEESRTASMIVRQRPIVAKSDADPANEPFQSEGQSGSIETLRYVIEFDEETESRRQQQLMPHEVEGVALHHFLPARIQISYNPPNVLAEAVIRALSGETRFAPNRSGIGDIAETPLPLAVLRAIIDYFGEKSAIAEKLNEALKVTSEIRVKDIGNFFRKRYGAERIPIEPIKDPDALRLDIIALLSKEGPIEAIHRRLTLTDDLRPACQFTENWFTTRVKYLGPLRDDPKALYPLVANIDPRDVGLRGEHTAAVFHVHRDQIIEYLPSENFTNPRIVPTRARRTLKFAVFEWLKYLGVATAVDTKDLGKLGHAMQVRLHDGDSAHDLTHVGVGVSQVLPIVVSCLLARPDTLLIFEQPELHLHPKVQTLLADFFLAMSMLGKQCVLETHSEYLINRLRFRAATAEAKQLVDTMEIYFVEKSGNQAKFRKVKVNEYGAIIDWPDGFFDQSQREAEQTLKAALAKKQEERKKR